MRESGFLKGQAGIAFILFVSGIIIEVAIAGTIITRFLGSSNLSERLSLRALVAAESGIRDAQVKITRNKEFVSSDLTPLSYSFAVGDDMVSVNVSRTTDSVSNSYLYTVAATGIAAARQRKLVNALTVDRTTGRVNVGTVVEQAVE